MNMYRFFMFFILILIYMNVYSQNLEGKNIAVLGDSYVKNHQEPVEYTWHYKFARKYKMNYYNYGINGNCVSIDRSNLNYGEAMYIRFKEMKDSLDYIIVIAGHNDSFLLKEIGGIEIYKDKLSILCSGLISKYPNAKIYFFTRWGAKNFEGSDFQKVVDASIEVCGNYSIPVMDCARNSNMFSWNDEFRKLYFQNKGINDTAHLNDKGHNRFLEVAERFILNH